VIARLCFAAAAGLACAQSPPPLEIRGIVVEGSLGLGGVEVTLYEFGHTPAESTTRTVFSTTSTDSKGAFIFHPVRTGEYYVEVQKEGYFAEGFGGPAVAPIDSTGDPVSIHQDHPLQERKFSLMRLGELRGRVIDEGGKPMAKLRVGIRPATSTQVITDQDGYFTATKLRSGDYQVWIVPQHGSQEILSEFSASDLTIVDEDLEISAWPSTPLPITPGASLNVGTITAHRALYYRAHLLVQGADCAAGERWTFSATPEMAGFGYPVPCAKELLVRSLAPGSYTFTLSTGGRPGDKKQRAVAHLEVTDKNLEVSLTMSPGSDVGGRIVASEGATLPPLVKSTIEVGPIAGPQIGGQRASPDAAGTFLVRGVSSDPQRVSMKGLNSKYYVQEVRYNGRIAADGIITPIAGTLSQLEIVIDDKAAIIAGSVAERDKISGRVIVVAVKWPRSQESTLLGGTDTEADDQGRFQIGGLAPGEYRVLALMEDTLLRANRDPARILENAEKIVLERGGSQIISLKIVEP